MQIVPWRAALALVYMAGIVWLSSLSGDDLVRLGLTALPSDVGHVVLFAGLAALTLWSLVGPGLRCGLIAFLICLSFAATDEWHQRFVPGRIPSLDDVVSDSIGIVLGLAFALALPLAWRALASRERLPGGGLEQ